MKSIFKKVFSSGSDDSLDELKRQMQISSERTLMNGTSGHYPGVLERRITSNGSISGSPFNTSPFGSPTNIPGQSVFGGSINNRPVTTMPPFSSGGMMLEMDNFNKAKILLEYLQSKGVKYINAETAAALFITNLYIGTEKEKIVKQPKKKLKF